MNSDTGKGGVAVLTDSVALELHINQDFDRFSDRDQEAVLKAVKNLIQTQREIRIVSKKRGSVILTLELSHEEAERVLWAVRQGALQGLSVADASIQSLPASKKRHDSKPLRYGDDKPDLWTTYNVVQEHLLRGGDRYVGTGSAGVRRTSTRPVGSLTVGQRLNRALWSLAEEFADN